MINFNNWVVACHGGSLSDTAYWYMYMAFQLSSVLTWVSAQREKLKALPKPVGNTCR